MFVFDPEPTIRNGQGALYAFEKGAAGSVVKTHHFSVGRPADEFHSCGLVSSSLMVENASSENDVSGSQSAMVMYSLPKDVIGLSSGDAINLLISRERDSVQNLRCSTDYTVTSALSDHMGASQQITRDVGINGPYYHSDSSTTPDLSGIGLTDANPLAHATLANALANASTALHYVTGENAPYTISTFKVDLDLSFGLSVTRATPNASARVNIFLTCVGLDHAGNVVATDSVLEQTTFDDISIARVPIDASFNLSSTTMPIASTLIYGSMATSGDTSYVAIGTAGSQAPSTTSSVDVNDPKTAIRSFESILGCESRPVHVHIIEGLKDDAVLSFNTGMLIAAAPSSREAGIANLGPTTVHDPNMVRMMFEVIGRDLERAFSGAGYAMTIQRLQGLIEEQSSDGADARGVLAAASVAELSRGFRKLGKYAKFTKSAAGKVANAVEPFADFGADLAIASGNPKAMAAGMAVKSGISTLGRARKMGLLD
jgi:hypothetical protein